MSELMIHCFDNTSLESCGSVLNTEPRTLTMPILISLSEKDSINYQIPQEF